MKQWPSEALLTAVFNAAPRDCITEARMAELTGRGARDVEMSVLKLRKLGLMEKTDRGCHKLTRAGRAAAAAGATVRSGPKGPRTGGHRRVRGSTVRSRAWLAMRVKGKFTVSDLVLLTAEGGEQAITNNLQRYVRALARVGYLRELRTRDKPAAAPLTSNGEKRYLLLPDRNTGDLAPTLGRGGIYDPNTEQLVAFPKVVA